jgi:hypothetical protein
MISANQWSLNTDPTLTSFATSIDYCVLNGAPGQILAVGQQHEIPLLAGFNFLALILAREPLTTSTAAY